MSELRSKLEQNLGWIILAFLLGGCLVVLLPFISALLWAVVLSASSWPLYRLCIDSAWHRKRLLVCCTTSLQSSGRCRRADGNATAEEPPCQCSKCGITSPTNSASELMTSACCRSPQANAPTQ